MTTHTEILNHIAEYERDADGVWLSRMVADAIEKFGGVPEGWRLVPVEPTPEMERAAMPAWLTRKPFADVYAAMLAASTIPPSPKEQP
jgi:hypothetical protein